METPLLNGSLTSGNGDYPPVRSYNDLKSVIWIETVKMWTIAAPIVFNMVCQYGINSVTNIFVGHVGDFELSAVAISLSVIGTFSFGFMVSTCHPLLLLYR